MAIDPAKAKSQTTYKHSGVFYSVCVEPASGRIFAGSDDYSIHVFDPTAKKNEPVAQWTKHDNYVSALVCVNDPAKPVIISGSYDRQLIWWDAAGGQPIRSLEAHEGWVRDLVLAPDGKRLVSVGDDMLVKVWETATGQLVRTLEGHAKLTPQGHVTALYTVAVSPDGKHIASGDRHGEVRVWEMDSGKLAQTFQVPVLYTYDPRQRKRSIGGIRSVRFSPDGQHLAVGGVGQIGNVDGLGGPTHLEIWDWRKPKQRLAMDVPGLKGLLNHLVYHPAEPWLLGGGGGDNGFLFFCKIDTIPDTEKDKKDTLPVQRHKVDGHVHRFCLHPTKNELYAAGYRKLEIWVLS